MRKILIVVLVAVTVATTILATAIRAQDQDFAASNAPYFIRQWYAPMYMSAHQESSVSTKAIGSTMLGVFPVEQSQSVVFFVTGPLGDVLDASSCQKQWTPPSSSPAATTNFFPVDIVCPSNTVLRSGARNCVAVFYDGGSNLALWEFGVARNTVVSLPVHAPSSNTSNKTGLWWPGGAQPTTLKIKTPGEYFALVFFQSASKLGVVSYQNPNHGVTHTLDLPPPIDGVDDDFPREIAAVAGGFVAVSINASLVHVYRMRDPDFNSFDLFYLKFDGGDENPRPSLSIFSVAFDFDPAAMAHRSNGNNGVFWDQKLLFATRCGNRDFEYQCTLYRIRATWADPQPKILWKLPGAHSHIRDIAQISVGVLGFTSLLGFRNSYGSPVLVSVDIETGNVFSTTELPHAAGAPSPSEKNNIIHACSFPGLCGGAIAFRDTAVSSSAISISLPSSTTSNTTPREVFDCGASSWCNAPPIVVPAGGEYVVVCPAPNGAAAVTAYTVMTTVSASASASASASSSQPPTRECKLFWALERAFNRNQAVSIGLTSYANAPDASVQLNVGVANGNLLQVTSTLAAGNVGVSTEMKVKIASYGFLGVAVGIIIFFMSFKCFRQIGR